MGRDGCLIIFNCICTNLNQIGNTSSFLVHTNDFVHSEGEEERWQEAWSNNKYCFCTLWSWFRYKVIMQLTNYINGFIGFNIIFPVVLFFIPFIFYILIHFWSLSIGAVIWILSHPHQKNSNMPGIPIQYNPSPSANTKLSLLSILCLFFSVRTLGHLNSALQWFAACS